MRATRFLLVVLVSIASVHAEDLRCPQSNSQTTYARLKQSLLCKYDNTIRPVVNHQNNITISFRIILKYFTYDVDTSTLGLDVWMRVVWTDQHLTWNPADYESIDNLILDTSSIWTPDISVFNRAVEGEDPSVISSTKCSISEKGEVKCVPSLHIDALCVPDLSLYPFDSQECQLRIGSWIHRGEEVDLKLLKNAVYMGTMEPNGEWKITGYTQLRYDGRYNNVTYPSIEIDFTIKRLSGAHAASVIIPTLVAVLLTLTSLFMSPLNSERLVLCYVNLVVQFMHVQYMSWQVPLKGINTPLILLFARDSLLLSAFTVVFTIAFKNLMNRESPAPGWIESIVAIAVGCPPGQFIFLTDHSVRGVASVKGEEDSAGIVSSGETKTEAWKVFGKILDVLLLVAYTICYFVMILKFIP